MRSRIVFLFSLFTCLVLAGCGSSARVPTQDAPQVASARFAFVADNFANSISTFKVDPGTGLLSSVSELVLNSCVNPSYVELHPTQPLLFVSCQTSNNLVTLLVDKNSGNLAMLAVTSTGITPRFIALDPQGKFLYVANAGSSTVSAFSVGTDGSLVAIAGSPFATGQTPYVDKIDDSGSFLYVTNRDTNNVSAFHIDPNTGILSEIAGSPFAADLGTRYIELSGSFAFVANRAANNVSVYTVNHATGALTQVPGSPFPAGTDPRPTITDNSGRFLYVGNTGSGDISAYSIDQLTGFLTPMSGAPFPTGVAPLHIEMDSMGKIVYVSDAGSNSIAVYMIDASTGALLPVQSMTTPGGPFSVALME